MRRPVLLLPFVLIAGQALPQLAEVGHYNVPDGLPQSMVDHVLQDAEGFMWLGTGDGLARFDGSRFIVYKHDPEDSTSLSQNEIWGIAQADPRHLYIGTRSGLDLMDTHTGIFKHLHTGYRGGKDGCWQPVWSGKDSAMFYSPLTRELLVHSASGFQRRAFAHGASYCRRISTDGRFLYEYLFPDTLLTTDLRDRTEDLRILPGKHRILDMLRLDNSWLMLGEKSAWRWMDDGSVQDLPGPLRELTGRVPGNKSVARQANGDLWMGLSGVGVVLLRPDLSVKEVYPLVDRPRSLRITELHFDHQGNLWAGTDGDGVFRIAPRRIKFGRMMPGILNSWRPDSWFVRGFAQWDPDHVLVSFDQGGLALFDERDRTLGPLNVPAIKRNGSHAQLLRDADGIIWAMDGTALIAVDPERSRVVVRHDNGYVRKLLLDRKGHLLAIGSDGVWRYAIKEGRLAKENVPMPSLQAWMHSLWNVPHDAEIDPLGRLWASIAGVRITVWSMAADGPPMEPFPMGVRLNQLFDNGDGTGWACTNNGLYCIRWKDLYVLRHLLPPRGPSDAFVYGMLADGKGHRWISSNRGLDRTSASMDTMRNYTIADGLQSMEFNSRALFRSARGVLYFGGINGFNFFLPGGVTDDPDGPRTALMRVWAQDSLVAYAKQDPTVVLPYSFNRLELEFAVLEMSDPGRASFRYRMAGFQDAWRTASPQRNLMLERIPAGSFVLEAQGLNADGVPGPVSQLLTIEVPLPFWASVWFNVLVGCLLAAGIAALFFIYYRRRKNIELARAERGMEELRLRTRLAQDIHDDIGSGLARIAALSRSPKRGVDVEERFEKLGGISSVMLHDLRDVVWMNDPRNDSLDSLLVRLREHAFDLFEGSTAVVTCDFPEPLPHRTIGGRARRNLLLIAKEALQNAHKYSGASKVVVHWAEGTSSFDLSINDDGCGIRGEVPQGSGNGSRNMKQRAEEMRAGYERTSGPNGTIVRVFGPSSLLDE